MIVDANAMGGFLVINPSSGQGPNAGELRREAERLDIDARILGPGDDPGDVARGAREGPIGAAGGDGSLAAVADVALSGAGRSSSSRSERATTWRGISGSTATTRSPHCGPSPGGKPGSTRRA